MNLRAIVLCSILAGCATPAQRQAHADDVANQAMATCARMGYAAKSPEWRTCAQNLYFQTMNAEAAQRAQTSAALAATGAALLTAPPPVTPQPAVVCRQTYMGTICQ